MSTSSSSFLSDYTLDLLSQKDTGLNKGQKYTYSTDQGLVSRLFFWETYLQ